ncbi:DOPA 4,5-dioxygenase family protein [Denitrobaculum tricleocarpae]|uniref:4,5-dioxygenase n=1 Tax=Denitrobaculum tricleocarpae TaxID=2591009 RepID=A0A545TP12_9PROT|nr:DOPA 4,5-dioxygenase family protein [Denitrobaculum tricleocarpae]TQV78953.1 4,5-dioxygenase [Denitrobaculum tricleocarpae]
MTDNSQENKEVSSISGYHAHVYYDAASKARAARLRVAIEERFDVELGRWRDDPVGPHPTGSYQVAFSPAVFSEIIPWLALNRDGLTIFTHTETGDHLSDHRDHAIWLGEQQDLKLSIFE